ncbi:MAG: NAD(P)/FAD-dependent oxidoreductase [Thermodesulfobacteriota bacterium]
MGRIRHLIIGNSAAAVNCIEAIRGVDTANAITVVSDEESLNYSRPLLSYCLGGRIDKEKLPFVGRDFYEKRGVNLILGKRAADLNVSEKHVTLDDGTSLSYDGCLLSVGGVSIVPPIGGLHNTVEGVFSFLTVKEIQALVDYIERNEIKEAVVLGGGLIGLKVVEGLLERGLKPTVVELADRILANTFDQDASGILEKRLAEAGCTVIKGDTIQGIDTRQGRLTRVLLRNSNEVLDTSLLIIAVGVRPNLELVRGTPVKTDRGILIDQCMRTNIQDVYAAGDCAQGIDLLHKTKEVIAIWPVAARQGRIAGLNMCGIRKEYTGLFPMNSVQICDIPTISFGVTNPPEEIGYEILRRVSQETGSYKKIVLKDGRVVGTILIRSIERAGVYGMLIREGVEVHDFKDQLLREDFGLLVLPKDFRKHLLGEVGLEV